MNWLEKYRLDPKYFNSSDELKEIFRFIQNHDVEGKSIKRDAKISQILGESYIDPLYYLNDFIDILNGKIFKTIQMSNEIITYIDSLTATLSQKNIIADTLPIKTIGDFKRVVDDNFNNDKKIIPYKIVIDINNQTILFRGAMVYL
jgi:hypothetical protein